MLNEWKPKAGEFVTCIRKIHYTEWDKEAKKPLDFYKIDERPVKFVGMKGTKRAVILIKPHQKTSATEHVVDLNTLHPLKDVHRKELIAAGVLQGTVEQLYRGENE
jgi:hypothetical protein